MVRQHRRTRRGVEGALSESDSVFNNQYNSAFVLMQYFVICAATLTNRPDNNFVGYDFWLNKMNQVSIAGENCGMMT